MSIDNEEIACQKIQPHPRNPQFSFFV